MKSAADASCRRCVFDRCFKNHRHSASAVPDDFPATFAQDLSYEKLIILSVKKAVVSLKSEGPFIHLAQK